MKINNVRIDFKQVRRNSGKYWAVYNEGVRIGTFTKEELIEYAKSLADHTVLTAYPRESHNVRGRNDPNCKYVVKTVDDGGIIPYIKNNYTSSLYYAKRMARMYYECYGYNACVIIKDTGEVIYIC